ncbi:hypothetical protein BDN67DRAFT_1007942 [Paxillus ammoniavirescens]|nr:hypothetical protein BDN67DRAFT_1007942 [Paxillus ammoniavirescens]
MFVASMAQTTVLHEYFQISFETGMRTVTAIYKKSLVLSNDERGRTSGSIIGLVTALNTTLPLTEDVIFPAISLFMLLQFPLAMFSQVTSNAIESIVSMRRLSEFLHAEELQQDAITRTELFPSVTQSSFEDINLAVRKGELFGVLGRVRAEGYCWGATRHFVGEEAYISDTSIHIVLQKLSTLSLGSFATVQLIPHRTGAEHLVIGFSRL